MAIIKQKNTGVSFKEACEACKTMTGYHVTRHPVYVQMFTLVKNKGIKRA